MLIILCSGEFAIEFCARGHLVLSGVGNGASGVSRSLLFSKEGDSGFPRLPWAYSAFAGKVRLANVTGRFSTAALS